MSVKVYSPGTYAKEFQRKDKKESAKTIIRRCEKGNLPSNAEAVKVGRVWIIVVGF